MFGLIIKQSNDKILFQMTEIHVWIKFEYRTPKSGVTALVVGGAQEALEHDSQNVPIVLRHRKGIFSTTNLGG